MKIEIDTEKGEVNFNGVPVDKGTNFLESKFQNGEWNVSHACCLQPYSSELGGLK